MTVPLDAGNLDVAPVRYQFCTLGIAQSGVEGLAGCVDDGGIENIGGTTGDPEFEWWIFGVMSVVGYCRA